MLKLKKTSSHHIAWTSLIYVFRSSTLPRKWIIIKTKEVMYACFAWTQKWFKDQDQINYGFSLRLVFGSNYSPNHKECRVAFIIKMLFGFAV